MIRKPRNLKYMTKAYYLHNEEPAKAFWCKDSKLSNITNEMGTPLPMSNGNRTITTESDIVFKPRQYIMIGNEKLTVMETNGMTNQKNLNALRGNQTYVQIISVQ